MYKKFFGFQNMPFSQAVCSDPDFVFTSQNFSMVLPTLVSSLDRNATLILVLGENGVGKTTFINYVYSYLLQDSCVRLINASDQSAQDFFQQVLMSFEQKAAPDAYELLMQLGFLNSRLNEQERQATILIIDDADSMTLDALKAIELLLGLNAENSPVLQLILVGQPRLIEMLNGSGQHGLVKNITAQCLLEPLSLEDTQDYINHKLFLAGVQNRKLFDEQACSVIHNYSKGIPVAINWVCDKALLRGNEQHKHEISSALIGEVIGQDTGASEKSNLRFFSLKFISAGLGLILALFFLPDIFISGSKGPQTELSKKLETFPTKDNAAVQISELVKAHQQEENQKGQVKKKTSAEGKRQYKISKQTMVGAQLAIAELQIANSKFTVPEQDNAYETYQAILKATPGDKRAKEGMQRIAKYYIDQAKKQYVKGRFEKSQRLVSTGLKVSPDNKELAELKKQIAVELKQAEREKKINTLLKQAERQVDALRLIDPLNDNAYKTYQDIAVLDKNNRQAKQGVLNILAQLKSAVQKSIDKERYTEAFERAKKITRLSSKGISDPFRKEAILTVTETRNIIDKQLKKLLSLAEKQLRMRQFTQPSGNNALESYNKILQLDPDSEEAANGLDILEKRYYELVKTAISEGKDDHAIETANEGLKAFPNDRELLSLRNSAILQKEMAVKKTEDYDSEKKPEDNDQELKNFGTF